MGAAHFDLLPASGYVWIVRTAAGPVRADGAQAALAHGADPVQKAVVSSLRISLRLLRSPAQRQRSPRGMRSWD